MTAKKISRIPVWAALLLWAGIADAKIRPANLFQDDMVLQCGMKIPIWGQADPGEKVTIRFGQQTRTAMAGTDGKWMANLDPLPANAMPLDLSISGSNVLTFKNVVVGEVWLASGQSNMQLSLSEAANHAQEITAADLPLVREFTVEREGSLKQIEEVKGAWKVCTPQTAGNFSAVAYFFARELSRILKIPVGIINASYGGTPAEAWTSREAMDSVPALRNVAEGQIAAMTAAPADLARFPAALSAWEEKYGVADGRNEGVGKGWATVDVDTADWKRATVPFTWASALGAKGGGAFWLRKEIDLPASAAGKPLKLVFGNLSEQYHTAYFNGEEVGRMGHEPPNFYSGGRSANVPGPSVKVGRNVIALRFVSHTEKGGFDTPGKALNLPVTDRDRVGDEWFVRAEKEFPPLPAGALDSRPKLNRAVMQYTSTTLYNEMIHPLIPCAFRGVIWYQGEANASIQGAGNYYRTLLSSMIKDWRARWGEGEFPFYIVQLANYAEVNRSHRMNPWALLRESQTWVARSLSNSGLAVTIDVGAENTIHPTDKQDVGKRLAYIALAKDYGLKDVPFQSPLYRDCIVQGEKILVRFEPGSGDLMVGEKVGLEPAGEVPGGKLTWFEIAGDDRKFVWAEARIDGDSVVVSSAEVPRPVAVRYAWAQNPQGCNLYNRAGLPASPFRTDDWP